MSVIIIFMIVQRIHKNKDILQIISKIDGREYIVRKLPDGREAAERLANINKKIIRLINVNTKFINGVKTFLFLLAFHYISGFTFWTLLINFWLK